MSLEAVMKEYTIEKMKTKDYFKCDNIWDMKECEHTQLWEKEIESGSRIVYVYKYEGEFLGECDVIQIRALKELKELIVDLNFLIIIIGLGRHYPRDTRTYCRLLEISHYGYPLVAFHDIELAHEFDDFYGVSDAVRHLIFHKAYPLCRELCIRGKQRHEITCERLLSSGRYRTDDILDRDLHLTYLDLIKSGSALKHMIESGQIGIVTFTDCFLVFLSAKFLGLDRIFLSCCHYSL